MTSKEAQTEAREPPNGGARAWLVTAGAFSAQMCTFGYINTFGVYQSYYENNFLSDYSPSSISWIGSFQAFLLFLFGALSGPLSDRLGVKAVIIPSGMALVFSVMMTSLSKEYYQFILSQGILGGIACGMIFTPVVSTVGQYFTTLRAWAMGLVVSGAAIGGIVFPITLNRLLTQVGFAWAVRTVGFLMLVLVIVASLTTKEFAPRRQKQLFIPKAFTRWPYIFANAGFLIGLLGLYGPIFYISSYCLSRGMDTELALYQVAILNAGSFFGRIIPNFLGDKIGCYNMNIISFIACSILCFCWTAATSTAGIAVWIIFFGFFSGAIFSLYSPTIAQGCPNPSEIGTYIGQGLAVCSLGGLAGTPINGALIRNYGYLSCSMFSGATLVVGAVCMLTARLILDKRLTAIV
ncbi:hypothetical protein FQN54_008608 [Arachnomyces sp. PD_36]|nr:hypothetical protein FQN54_008608 [Arachnomyces sp. PD_36]